MTVRAVIAHCWTGTPAVGWYPAAKSELSALGYHVEVPALPETDAPDPVAWRSALDAIIANRADETLLVGHSLGALAVLHWLAAAPETTSLAGLFLVAPPLALTGIKEVDRFLQPPPNLRAVRGKMRQAAVLVSDEDKYLLPDPGTIARYLETTIGARSLVSAGRGHFSAASGLRSLPELSHWAAGLNEDHNGGTD